MNTPDAKSTFEIFTQSGGRWVATPWDYSSLCGIIFYENQSADLIFGYGQTIYAKIKAKFELSESGYLNFTYLDSPPFAFFKGFTANSTKKIINFSLSAQNNEFNESIVAGKAAFEWKSTLDQSVYPDEIQFPYEVPLEFYGHRISD